MSARVFIVSMRVRNYTFTFVGDCVGVCAPISWSVDYEHTLNSFFDSSFGISAEVVSRATQW